MQYHKQKIVKLIILLITFGLFQNVHADFSVVKHNWAILGPGGRYGIWEYAPEPGKTDITSAIKLGVLGEISFPCNAYTLSVWTIIILSITVLFILFFYFFRKEHLINSIDKNRQPKSIPIIAYSWIIFSILLYIWGFSIFSKHNPFGRTTNIYDYSEAIIKICLAIIACISSIFFLKKQYWSRNMLEILTWILLAYIALESINFLRLISWNGQREFGPWGILTTTTITLLYACPTLLTLKYLRSEKIKKAMHSPNRIVPTNPAP